MTREERETLADKMARYYCEACGLDPDEEVGLGDGDDEYYDSLRTTFFASVNYSPRFCMYRRTAMEHILMAEAMQKATS